jgi:hypothetical protein
MLALCMSLVGHLKFRSESADIPLRASPQLECWNDGMLEKWDLIVLRVPSCVFRVKGFVLRI